MSRGSYFTLYIKKNGTVTDSIIETLHDTYVKKHKDDISVKVGKGDKDRHPRFYESSQLPKELAEKCDMVDSDTNELYNRCFSFRFPSIFSELRELWDLNSYDPRTDYVDISKEEARIMLQAVEYLLVKKYDSDIERAIDNPYIEEFGNLISEYSEYKYRKMFPNDTDYHGEESNELLLNHLRTVFRAFLDADEAEENDLKLIYWVWG